MIFHWCGLTSRRFFKSMTTKFDHTVWQDDYHAMVPVGEMAYIKVTDYHVESARMLIYSNMQTSL